MRDSIIRQFGKPEGVLGSLVGRIMSYKNRERIDWVTSLLSIKPGQNILEIGYGPGAAIEKIGGITGSGKIVGIDHSKVMLKQASKRNAALIKENKLALYAGTIDDLNPEMSFDIAFAINVIIFWKDPVAELKKIYKRINPGGKIFIAVQARFVKEYAEVKKLSLDVESQIIKAGFAIHNVEFRKMNPYGAFCIEGIKPAPLVDYFYVMAASMWVY